MNLFKVDKSIWSHPHKPYVYHIENIANSFEDKAHRVSANFHDIGKLSNEFQQYIRKETDKKTTHAIEGGYLFTFLTESIDEDFLSIFFSIVKHHISLSDIRDNIYKYSNVNENDFDKESWSKKLAVIERHLGVESQYNAEDFHNLMRMFIENFENFSTIEQFFLFKKRYSRLILADKFEAIFDKPYKNIDYLQKSDIDKYIQNIYDIIKSKPINKFRNSVKKTIFDNYKNNPNSNIYLIKAPTGVGKTFIALELALQIAKDNGDKRRIITAIPFTSIIDQTHKEYENILGDVLKYHHLTKYKIDDDEKEQFSQKIFLSDIWHEHFIVTTFNQLLYTLFSNHNRDNLRLETLRDSVIIVDEVQNIPRVLLKSVSFVFNQFAKIYNINFIIMSATMPKIDDEFDNTIILSQDWFYQEKKNRYILSYMDNIGEYEILTDTINSQISSVLCVVNTIEKAKKLYQMVDDPNCYLLTTHQTPQHRKAIIRLIKYRLKKGDKIKLISTQLIEAGVDLDFDIGYREFAPFGSLIQMAGRVNREGNREPSKVIVFDYIEGKNAPYQAIDLQEEKIKKLLCTPLNESDLLENMDRYFIDIKYETSSIDLIKYMKNLEFKKLFDTLNENFMPNQPWKVSLFIEQKPNHFRDFIAKRELLFDKYDKFDAINHLKDLEKDLGKYTISVNRNLLNSLPYNLKEQFGRYILPFGSKYYTKRGGFNLQLTIEEEAFS